MEGQEASLQGYAGGQGPHPQGGQEPAEYDRPAGLGREHVQEDHEQGGGVAGAEVKEAPGEAHDFPRPGTQEAGGGQY